jgi:hypothetical protein
MDEDLLTQAKLKALQLMGQDQQSPVGMGDVKEAESGNQRIDNPQDIPQEVHIARQTLGKEPNLNDIISERQRVNDAFNMGTGAMGSLGKVGQVAKIGQLSKPIVQEVAPNTLRWNKTLIKTTALPADKALDIYNAKNFPKSGK